MKWTKRPGRDPGRSRREGCGRRLGTAALAVALALGMLSSDGLSFERARGASPFSDAAYAGYANLDMGSSIPGIFLNDSTYYGYRTNPPVINGGTVYVPLDAFANLRDVTLNFSEDNTSFYIQNKKGGYISFRFNSSAAVIGNSKVINASPRQFYSTYYLPLAAVCGATGIGYEVYDDPSKGLFAVKIYTSPGLSAENLVKIYAPNLFTTNDAEAPEEEGKPEIPSVNDPPAPAVYTPGTDREPPVKPVTDPEIPEKDKRFGKRTLYLCIEPGLSENTAAILDVLKKADIRALFFLTGEDIMAYPDTVRRIVTDGHTPGICVGISDEMTDDEFRKAIADTQSLLFETARVKTRLFRAVSGELAPAADGERAEPVSEIVTSLGMRVVSPAISAGTGSGYASTAWTKLESTVRNMQAVRRTEVGILSFEPSGIAPDVLRSLFEFRRKFSADVRIEQITETSAL